MSKLSKLFEYAGIPLNNKELKDQVVNGEVNIFNESDENPGKKFVDNIEKKKGEKYPEKERKELEAKFNKNVKEKVNEETDEEKTMAAIKSLIETDWGVDNESQGKAAQMFKGLSFSDVKIANDFMDDINKYTSSLKDKYLK